MADEKDRLGDKLHDVGAAREDQWAHQQDQELINKMKDKIVSNPLPKVIVITGHENDDVRVWLMDEKDWMESIFKDKIINNLQSYIADKATQNEILSPIKYFIFIKADGYPHLANEE